MALQLDHGPDRVVVVRRTLRVLDRQRSLDLAAAVVALWRRAL